MIKDISARSCDVWVLSDNRFFHDIKYLEQVLYLYIVKLTNTHKIFIPHLIHSYKLHYKNLFYPLIKNQTLCFFNRRRGGKYAAGSACIGGGQGIAILLENVN